jgi:hypothetical protein
MSIYSNKMLNDIVEELPEGIEKRVKISGVCNIPMSSCGELVFDFDKEGKLIDSYFDEMRNKVYTSRIAINS